VYKKVLAMVGVLLLSGLVFAEESGKDYSIILDEREKKLVFEQCSRMTPTFRSNYRDLSNEVVEKIEQMLPDAVNKAAKGKSVNIDDYYRQYVAFEILRREFVYVNAFNKADVMRRAKGQPAYGEQFGNWESKAVNVCGGEMAYWGVIYDNETETIAEVLFNTRAKTD